MRDWLKIRAKPIVVVALVGLASVAILLSLATRRGDTQARGNPEETLQPAWLQVNYRSETSRSYNWASGSKASSRDSYFRETMDASIQIGLSKDFMFEAHCDELEATIRRLKKECGQLPAHPAGPCANIKNLEQAARECRQNTPRFGLTSAWLFLENLPEYVPTNIRLISAGGQVSYFEEIKQWEKATKVCNGGKDAPEQPYERTYVTTWRGSDAFKLGPKDGFFSMTVHGDKVTDLDVHSHGFSIAGQSYETESGCRGYSRSEPLEGSHRIIGAVLSAFKGPEGVVSVSRTPTGYSGSATYRKTITEGRTTTTETRMMTFAFDIGGAAEVVVTPPKNLREWIPKGGQDENAAGDKLKFTGQVQEKKGSKGGGSRKVKVVFELTSSREPGIAMNFPPKASDPPRPDLQILKDGTSSAFKITEKLGGKGEDAEYKAEGEFKVGESFTLVVGSFDYGAYGYLNISADAPVRIEDYPDTNRVWLPKDDNKNSIADKWEKDMDIGGKASDWDEDFKPEGDGTPGDGLSFYEEYRGFMVQGNHIRTNPKYKDLFIFDQNNLGIGKFARSGLTLHLVKNGEFAEDPKPGVPNPNVINLNNGIAHLGTQHLLRMKNGPVRAGVGIVLPENDPAGPPGPPKTVRVVIIDVTKLGKKTQPSTIAHELAHGSNVAHHGENDYEARSVQGKNADGNWETWGGGEGKVAAPGGQHSGVQQCIMRYNSNANLFEVPGGRYRWRKVFPDGREGLDFIFGERYMPFEDEGTIFCERPDGTGVNAPGGFTLPDGRKVSKAGKATRGSCKKQFCVNDTRPCQYKP
jgi:hypothetical protein